MYLNKFAIFSAVQLCLLRYSIAENVNIKDENLINIFPMDFLIKNKEKLRVNH